jgi:hypothetical protein
MVLLGQTRNLIFGGLAVVGLLAWLFSARLATDPICRCGSSGTVLPSGIGELLDGFALFGVITYLPTFLQVVSGLSAIRAGLVLTALMAGVLVGTVGSGRLITRSGRYKIFPLVGTAIAAVGLILLALLLDSDQPLAIAGVMIIVGLGIGLVMQVMVLAAQNGAAYADLESLRHRSHFSTDWRLAGWRSWAPCSSAPALEPAAAAQTLAARMLVIGGGAAAWTGVPACLRCRRFPCAKRHT